MRCLPRSPVRFRYRLSAGKARALTRLLLWASLWVTSLVLAPSMAGRSGWFFFVILTSLLIWGYWGSRMVLAFCQVARTAIPASITTGDVIVWKVVVDNKWRWWPMWMQVIDGHHVPEGSIGLQWGCQKQEWNFQWQAQRGVYNWDELVIKVGDILGVGTNQKKYNLPFSLWVYPAYLDLPVIPGRGSWGEGLRMNRGLVNSNYLRGIRDYRDGDRLSQIDWRATARTSRFKVREWEQEVHKPAFLLLDCSSSQTNDSFELAVAVAASLGCSILNSGLAVELTCITASGSELFKTHGKVLQERLLQYLTMVKAEMIDADEVSQQINQKMSKVNNDAKFILISSRKMDSVQQILQKTDNMQGTATIFSTAIENIAGQRLFKGNSVFTINQLSQLTVLLKQ